MAEIVNLRMARKRAERASREEAAATNRAVHGRPKAEREADRRRAETEATRFEGHRREPSGAEN